MNNNSSVFLAIDIGASSGRAILGALSDGRIELKEVSRFSNPIININGGLYWNLFHLFTEILNALKKVKADGITISSLGIDTWGVDFACFGKDGELLKMPHCYRDARTIGAPELFFSKISKDKLYEKTGIQIMNFNTLFQLFVMQEKSSIFQHIDKILFMPDALSYLLTGKMVTEYSIASTSQMLNPFEGKFDENILEMIGLNVGHFASIVHPGTEIGILSESVQQQTGLENVKVIAVAGHDTASAVLAVPAKNKRFAYLSSGTWSLMGIESDNPIINEITFTHNFTNEGGADGSTRLLSNICGMWIIERCKQEWDMERDKPISYEEIVKQAMSAKPLQCSIYPDAACFVNPHSMIKEIQNFCQKTGQYVPKTIGEISRCIYESLALRYKQVFLSLQQLSKEPLESLYIVGGGSKNKFLNSFTANALGVNVFAGPVEATAMGNIMLQAKAMGFVSNKEEIRQIISKSIQLEIFEPEETEIWDDYFYQKYLNVVKDIETL